MRKNSTAYIITLSLGLNTKFIISHLLQFYHDISLNQDLSCTVIRILLSVQSIIIGAGVIHSFKLLLCINIQLLCFKCDTIIIMMYLLLKGPCMFTICDWICKKVLHTHSIFKVWQFITFHLNELLYSKKLWRKKLWWIWWITTIRQLFCQFPIFVTWGMRSNVKCALICFA